MARPPKTTPKPDLKGIRQGKDGRFYWDVVRTLPDSRKWRRASDHADVTDAIEARAEALREFERVRSGEQELLAEGYTVKEWCEHCLTAIMPNQANRRHVAYDQGTLYDYRSILQKHVYPLIGDVRLKSLNTDHVDALISGIATPHLKRNAKNVLSRCMSLAEDRDKRPRNSNPCRAVRLPAVRHQRTKDQVINSREVDPTDAGKTIDVKLRVADGLNIDGVRVLDFNEEKALLDHVKEHKLYSDYLTLLLLGLKLGLRLGEALGLDWTAVDFEANTVRISQQVQREIGSGVKVKDIKGHGKTRVIPMPKSLAEHLKGLKQTCPHVVHNNVGKRRDQPRAQERIRELMIGAGLDDRVEGNDFIPRPSFHDLRRTCLTRLATGNLAPNVRVTPCPPTTLIRISGHEDVSTLLSYYTKADGTDTASVMANMP